MTLTGILKFLAFAALALVAAVAVSIAIKPQLRAALLAELNDPADLPPLSSDERIHFEPEARACAELGFTHGQGFHIGRPRPIEQL